MSVFRRAFVMLCAALILVGSGSSAGADVDLDADTDFPDEVTVDATLDCSFVLTDKGESLGDATPIVVAAEALQQFGDVRIRVFDQTATGSLDDELADMANTCGWLDADGNYPPNLFVFGVSIADKATRVLYGSEWAPGLDDSASVIIDRVVNAQFANSNYQGGLIGGIEQFAALRADADGVSAESAELPTTEPGVADQGDADEAAEVVPADPETNDTNVPAADGEQSGIAADESDIGQTAVTVESQGSNTGFYALIAGVLVAITVLPALLLRRSRNGDDTPGDS